MIGTTLTKMKLVFVLSLLALYVSATPTGIARNPKGRIYNGNNAEKGQFPYQVLLMPLKCSGAILSKDWVVSASYCVDYPKITVQAGSIFLWTYDPNKLIVEVEKIYDYFHPGRLNKLALFKLKTPFTFNANLQPIRIWKEPVPDDTVLTVSGWGSYSYYGETSNYLQYTSLRVISAEECKQSDPNFYEEYRMCANTTDGRRRHLCRGDLGNPLVFYRGPEPLLVGVAVDVGYTCGQKDIATPFVKIHKYVDWIQNVTGLDL